MESDVKDPYEEHQKIVWIASYPKSGNTWVRCFLDAYFLGEVDLNDIVTSIGDDRADLYQIGDGSAIQNMPLHIQQMMRPAALVRLVRLHNESKRPIPLFVKTHNPNMIPNGVETLPQGLTKATICIVRDPRDIVPSFAKHMGCDLDTAIEWMQDKYRLLTSSEQRVGDFISSWDMNVNSFLNDDCHGTLYVKYEDMQANPVDTFSKILYHSGVTPDVEKVRKALEVTALDNLRRKEQEHGFSESSAHAKNQFFGKGEIGGWKKKLEPRHAHKIERAFGRTMKRLGYIEKRRAA